ncbi:MAG TPA: NAD(P)H-hydrate epimerase, partial [Luteimonas sp.]|nr:NAD(P)H-hydrate epimerase [Luteimonas sp.]
MPSPLPLYRPQQVRDIDARAIEEIPVSAFELMERAGAAAWASLHKRWPKAKRIAVACGPGNNGGDGYVLARLAKAAGCKVQVVMPHGAAPRTPEARQAAASWREAGGRSTLFDGLLPEADVWVDALFGVGLRRAPEDMALAMIERINASR